MIPVMSRDSEARLVAASERMSELVERGDTPDDAAVKSAQEFRLPVGHLDLLCRSYNVGQQAVQRETGNSVLDKLAAFPLADAEAVKSRLYPAEHPTPAEAKNASEVSADYGRGPNWYKDRYSTPQLANLPKQAAESRRPLPVNPEFYVERSRKIRADAEKFATDIRMLSKTAARQVLGAFDDALGAIKVAVAKPDNFPWIERAALLAYGDSVEPLFDRVAETFKPNSFTPYKRAADIADEPKQLVRVDPTQSPWRELDAVVKIAAAAMDEKEILDEALARLEQKVAEMDAAEANLLARNKPRKRSIFDKAELSHPSSDCEESTKAGGTLGNLLLLTTSGRMVSDMLDTHRTYGDLVNSEVERLDDPQHLGEMRGIRTQSMLHDFLNNDPVISGYEPEKVFEAYNEIARTAPRLAQNPAAVRPFLHRWLQGNLQPFDVGQLTDLDLKLRPPAPPAAPSTPARAPNLIVRTL
jgi:hypothetical protein